MISGIFENCIGTKDLDAALKYWAEFGYREVKRGHLDTEAARSLYGHASPLIDLLGNKSKAQREFYSFHPFLSRI